VQMPAFLQLLTGWWMDIFRGIAKIAS